MDLYEAGSGRQWSAYIWPKSDRQDVTTSFLSKCCVLQSYYSIGSATWGVKNHHLFRGYLLDSGAFSLAYNGTTTATTKELYVYADKYADFVKTYHVERYFELDIDSIIGIPEARQLRDRIEHRVGWQSIPVWHISRGKQAYLDDCRDYTYVAIGGLAQKRQQTRKIIEPAFQYFIDTAHEHGAWIHALGYTDIKALTSGRYQFDSVDSTRWVHGNIAGTLYRYHNGIMRTIKAPEGKRIKPRETAVHNFCEWARFGFHLDETYPHPVPLDPPKPV